MDRGHARAHTDCFVISGGKALEGMGTYFVIAVGVKRFNGRIMMGVSYILQPYWTRDIEAAGNS